MERRQFIQSVAATAVSVEAAFAGADAVLVTVNHPEYAKLDLPKLLATLRRPAVVFDAWRIFDEEIVRHAGAGYAAIGYG